MVIDTSALLCVFFDEPERAAFGSALMNAAIRRMAAPSYVEACLVVASRKGPGGVQEFDLFIEQARIEIVPFAKNEARIAARAFIRFGKGRHPARLNFGECMSYALAKTEMMPLLFKGGDFRQTDIEAEI